MIVKAFLGTSLNGIISSDVTQPAHFSSKQYMSYLHQHLLKNYPIKISTGATIRAYGSSIGGGHQIVFTNHAESISANAQFFKQRSITKRSTLGLNYFDSKWDEQYWFTTWDNFFAPIACPVAILGGQSLIDSLILAKKLTHLEICLSPCLFKVEGGALLSKDCDVSLNLIDCKIARQEVILNYSLSY